MGDPQQAIELRTTKTNDFCLALTGLVLGSMVPFGGASVWSPYFSRDARDVRGGAILVSVYDALGPAPLAAGFALFGLWLLCIGIGGAWRLIDRRPAILADGKGLQFHPSVCLNPVSWSEVRYIRNVEGPPAQVRIGLGRRFWSPLAWLTATSIRLNRIALGLSVREAREIVRQLKALAPSPL
jgi:hypothetical protein